MATENDLDPKRLRGAALMPASERREWSARGARKAAENRSRRRAEVAAVVAFAVIDAQRTALSQVVEELRAATDLDSARKSGALVAAIRTLNMLAGFNDMAREIERLRAEVTELRAWQSSHQSDAPRTTEETP